MTPAVNAWQSELYPAGWSATPDKSFESDRIIADFSHAGYMQGDKPIPNQDDAKVFNVVTDFNADPTGQRDSTQAIQNAITAAGQHAGGGVVFLPAGLYRVAPQSDSPSALTIASSNIVLRGAGVDKTFLLNTSTQMRQKAVISVIGPDKASWHWEPHEVALIRHDLLTPTRDIPVDSVEGFSVGDPIIIRADVTVDWAKEHHEPKWIAFRRVGPFLYPRQIVAIDRENNVFKVDVPIRYFLRTRDAARVYRKPGMLEQVGLEHFSIGNVQHPGSGRDDWSKGAWNGDPGTAGYESHDSWLIRIRRTRDSWVRHVNTFAYEGNTSGAHLLSNALLLHQCHRVTVSRCHFQKPQYGGGGGNGYLFRMTNAADNLMEYCIADFSRHGFVFSSFATTGNVLHRCEDLNTGLVTGLEGRMSTTGSGSDHHMQFSHANLVDQCTVTDSYFAAFYRPGDTHQLSSSHSVFWNIRGKLRAPGQKPRYPYVVWSQQVRYGYVIGTSGEVHAVRTDPNNTREVPLEKQLIMTAPVDHVEGVGKGETLEPQSLYLDQLKRRLQR